jgi:hypothetical protein
MLLAQATDSKNHMRLSRTDDFSTPGNIVQNRAVAPRD